MIRSHLVKALYKNLLGPSNGVEEIIQEPFLKYELGILNSYDPTVTAVTDSEISPEPADIKDESISAANKMQSINALHQVDNDLMFKIGTFSLGLYFVLKGQDPKFKVCLTWARYEQDKRSANTSRMFRRCPNFYVSDVINAASGVKINMELKNNVGKGRVTKPGVWLHVTTSKIRTDEWIVRAFLVNRTKHTGRIKEEDRVFQPQIRVAAVGKSELVDLDVMHGILRDRGYEKEDLLYMKSHAKARGYMCAAVWSDVDPEVDHDGDIGGISWPDSHSVPEDVKKDFTHPLVRTEYLPLYAVLQPDQSKRPTFSAFEMSSEWNPAAIEKRLAPLVDNFSNWIERQREDLRGMNLVDGLEEIGRDNLDECSATRDRIRAGITFLKNSEKARAAFCFMNAVMNDKRRNEEKEDLRWREFQMAFIVQSLRGVSGESVEDRNSADILWFPTGGGKTEAYLGIVIFAIAYRRLDPGDTLDGDGGVSVISRYTLRLLTMQQFQRALGAIVAADVRRVENWLPDDAQHGAHEITDEYMRGRLSAGTLWGNQRFSIGIWIGSDTTPKNFAYIKTPPKGKVILNAEGALLPQGADVRKFSEPKGDPAQITACPVCSRVLCLPETKETIEPTVMTWVIRSTKPANDLRLISKEQFKNSEVRIIDDPKFDQIGDAPDRMYFHYMTLKISPQIRRNGLNRRIVDKWWEEVVRPILNPVAQPLESTSPSMPGYFFLQQHWMSRPYDFAIFCTNPECKLNMTDWFESTEGSQPQIPEAFQADGGRSKSVPISAYTTDEQIYTKCPSFLIATVDKFANLPFEPKCASLFGNVDVFHKVYGYGRRSTFESPVQKRNGNKREEILPRDLHNVDGFRPPSLILQDELHLIEGPLGSMVGIYEMGVDVLSGSDRKPKYIASSATIKEAQSQVGTIFRRKITTFPPMGIDASDNYFSEIEEDVKCTKDSPGRLYMGIATTKSTVTLPIKAQSIVMSEIFKIKTQPAWYDLPEDTEGLPELVDPYWTFVSYFTDLQLLSKFNNYYSEDITENVERWSAEKAYNSAELSDDVTVPPGLRLFTLVSDIDMIVNSVSVYCASPSGNIRLALYTDGDPVGSNMYKSDFTECASGENIFVIPEERPVKIKRGEKTRIAIINDRPASFQAVVGEGSLEYHNGTEEAPLEFPRTYGNTSASDVTIRISINSQRRQLRPDGNVVLYSETTAEDLSRSLDRLKSKKLEVDSLQTSPVFGTGIDVDRLGVMEVMNQPKTSSGYIQATGRVGRTKPGLVINWLRAGRARDLNHYENFIGYHIMLHRFVEPVTASPFSLKAMDMCLGPVMASILRNARSVQNTTISTQWVDSEKGPAAMAQPRCESEVEAVRDALWKIVSSEHVAEYRKMDKAMFNRIFEKAKTCWKRMAYNATKDGSRLPYAERNPNKIPSSNVILGSPNHKVQELEYAYENTPNSLRQTESTAVFNRPNEHALIRPSQFTTRYGPGALLSGKSTTWVIPSVQGLVGQLLQGKGNFNEKNKQEKLKLDKYEIFDSRMERILNRLLPKSGEGYKIKLFSLPTNSSLGLGEFADLYECSNLTEWAICYSSHHHYTKILAKTSRGGQVVKCPECKRRSATGESRQFYTVRYMLACKRGHLGDVDWEYEVHRESATECRGDVFEWRKDVGNDNVRISCRGHWKGDDFIRSSCNGSVTYKDLKIRSETGQMGCPARFAEGLRDPHGCEKVGGKSQAKMISKSQMSLRLPIVTTTMEIQRYEGVLFSSYKPIGQYIDTFMGGSQDFDKSKFVQFLEDWKNKKRKGFTSQLISKTIDAPERTIIDVIKKIQASLNIDEDESRNLTELQALEDEMDSLENQTRDYGRGPKVGLDDSEPDSRFPIRFRVRGISFEAMPFDNISVTQVQTGYTREISPPTPEDPPQDDQSDMLRIGEPVIQWSRYRDDDNRSMWHVASQLIGEGIFIHLDPEKHDDGYDVLRQQSKSFQTWKSIHTDVKRRNEKNKELSKENSEQTDALEMESVLTNPLFVWWHSFVHKLISQLAIDSGFMGASLGERVYCIERSDGSHLSGVLIYAASPGADGTLGGLTSLVDKEVLPKIVEKALDKIAVCSNDPLCWDRDISEGRRTGSACHACLMNSETSCAYQNKFLDRNLVGGVYDEIPRGS